MAIGHWELETGGTLGQGGEYQPVGYPRSDEVRGQSDDNNKGGASRTDSIAQDREMNKTGDEQSPRNGLPVDYKVGPYPVVDEESETEGSGTA